MKDLSTLQKMKGIEEKKEKAQILRVLSILKDLAKKVQENKELCSLYLDEVCKDDKEKKQIIDWINSLDDVQLTDDRKKELREDVKSMLSKERQKIDRQFDEKPELINAVYTSLGTSGTTWGSNATSNSISAIGLLDSNVTISGYPLASLQNDYVN